MEKHLFTAIHTPSPAPRLLLGSALLFWGAMTGRPLLGLVLALVAEGCHWTRIRWDFDDDACGKVWQFTSVGIALAAVLIWLDGNRYTALPVMLSWLPPLLIPMQFVQAYGLRDALPLNTFSFLAKRNRERNRRLGLIENVATFNFGNPLFAATMVGASVGTKSESWTFLPGLVILSGWMLMSKGRGRPLLLVPVLILAGLLAMTGRIALEKAEDWIGQSTGEKRDGFDPNFTSTLIGTAGTIRQSSGILWRLHPFAGSGTPRLLRTATYNNYLGTSWRNQRLSGTDFKDLDTRLIAGEPHFLLQEESQAQDPARLSGFRLRGSAAEETPLPLPGDSAMLREFELEGIEINTYGTVRVYPKHPVIDGTVFWKSGGNPESPPLLNEDYQIPIVERDAIRETLAKLGLTRQTPLRDQLAILRGFFLREFRYTRSPTIRQPFSRIKGHTAIDRFLTTNRAGHCEYFASAAVLLLREAGIPARYATGYAVLERDTKHCGYLIRGTHGHAWCRVWDAAAGLWIDFDPTPPDWLASVSEPPSLMQGFNDNLKRWREDFFLWRNRPTNRLTASLVMLGIGLALAGFVARRLWSSRRRLESGRLATRYAGPVIRTPLHQLETRARKILGERLPGQPFSQWIARLHAVLTDCDILDEAIAIHQRLRFDPAPPHAVDQERLVALTARIEAALKTHGGFPQERKGRA